MNKKLKKNIGLDYICTFLTNLNMQSSIWVLYLAYCGMNLLQIGILEGLYHATGIICEIPSGALADLVGRKKSIILGKICITISCFLMLFGRNFWIFAFSFIIQALGNNFNSGSEEALVYDSMLTIHEEDAYIKVNGRLNMIIEVAQSAATVIGGVLAEYSYAACYGASTVISVLAFLPVMLMCEPPVLEKQEREKSSCIDVVKHHFKMSFDILRSDLRILKVIVYFAIVFAAHTLLFFYSQQYYYGMGFNKIQISIVMFFGGLASCFGALTSDRLYKKLQKKLAVIGAIVIAGTLIFYGFENVILSIGMFILADFFNSALYPVESESLNSMIPSQQRATLISVNSMFFSIVMIVIFPLAGAFADYFALAPILMVIGIMLFVFVISWSFVAKHKNK